MHLITVEPGESITAAAASFPDDGEKAVIRLKDGIYREKVEILRGHTTLVGSGMDRTFVVWDDGAHILLPDGMKRGTFRTATLRTDGDEIRLEGISIENRAAPREKVGQAVALYADGDGFVCEDCALRSFQDTLFTAPLPPREIEKNGFIGPKQFAPRKPQRHLYRHCRISGDVDFIFGGAAAYFEECDIIACDGREDKTGAMVAYCTAPSTPEGQKVGYVFDRCRFLSEGLPEGSVYLGRPWREYARAVFLRCRMGRHIHPALFHDWDKRDFHARGLFGLYRCEFEGAVGPVMEDTRFLTDEEADAFTLQAWENSLQG